MASSTREKQRYWEIRLWDLLRPIDTVELLQLSWALEALRDGRATPARKHLNFPGEPEDHKISGKYFIAPWSIDAVIREKLVLGKKVRPKDRRLNLKSWPGVAKLFNTYGGLANVESVMD